MFRINIKPIFSNKYQGCGVGVGDWDLGLQLPNNFED